MINTSDEQIRGNLSESEMNNIVSMADKYYFGNDTFSIDKSKAFKLYESAADNGDCYAQLMAGYMSDYGDGVLCDVDKAIYYYSLAAKQGDNNAALNLANIYLLGRNVPVNSEKGVDLMRTAAEMGNAVAAFSLGRLYAIGLHVKEDLDLAAYWIENAEKNGYTNCETMLSLGLLYEKRCKYAEAFTCICKALSVDSNDANAHYLYGYYKFYGLGTNKDLSEAKSHIEWVVLNCPNDEEAQKLLLDIKNEEQQASTSWIDRIIKIDGSTLYAADGKIYIIENQKVNQCGYVNEDGIFDNLGIKIGGAVSKNENSFVLNGIYTYVYNNYGLLQEDANNYIRGSSNKIARDMNIYGKRTNIVCEISKSSDGYIINEAFKNNYTYVVTKITDISIAIAAFVCYQRYSQHSQYYDFYS
jgi:tetratricopeptide (TPR) repeat protein